MKSYFMQDKESDEDVIKFRKYSSGGEGVKSYFTDIFYLARVRS